MKETAHFSKRNKSIILISDGENFEDDAVATAKEAAAGESGFIQ